MIREGATASCSTYCLEYSIESDILEENERRMILFDFFKLCFFVFVNLFWVGGLSLFFNLTQRF